MIKDPIAYIVKEDRVCWWCGAVVPWPRSRDHGSMCATCEAAGVGRMTPAESLAFRAAQSKEAVI